MQRLYLSKNFLKFGFKLLGTEEFTVFVLDAFKADMETWRGPDHPGDANYAQKN